jgi:hypothetical protein
MTPPIFTTVALVIGVVPLAAKVPHWWSGVDVLLIATGVRGI